MTSQVFVFFFFITVDHNPDPKTRKTTVTIARPPWLWLKYKMTDKQQIKKNK